MSKPRCCLTKPHIWTGPSSIRKTLAEGAWGVIPCRRDIARRRQHGAADSRPSVRHARRAADPLIKAALLRMRTLITPISGLTYAVLLARRRERRAVASEANGPGAGACVELGPLGDNILGCVRAFVVCFHLNIRTNDGKPWSEMTSRISPRPSRAVTPSSKPRTSSVVRGTFDEVRRQAKELGFPCH